LPSIFVPINQYDLNGIFLKKWDSITDAVNELGIKNITKVLSKERPQAGGYIFRYIDDNDVSPVSIKIQKPYSKKVLDMVTNVTYNSIRELSRVVGKDSSHLRKSICAGKTKYKFI
jgi:hypothetical protein